MHGNSTSRAFLLVCNINNTLTVNLSVNMEELFAYLQFDMPPVFTMHGGHPLVEFDHIISRSLAEIVEKSRLILFLFFNHGLSDSLRGARK